MTEYVLKKEYTGILNIKKVHYGALWLMMDIMWMEIE